MHQTPSEPPPSSNEDHKLILAKRVLGTRVYNREGEHIGSIDDLSIDRITGKTRYAILSFGGFLGIGERFHPLPWSTLDYDPRIGGYVVPLDKAALADAPHYDRTELAELGGPSHQRHADSIYAYYGVAGYPF